jgi:hypothetical protein
VAPLQRRTHRLEAAFIVNGKTYFTDRLAFRREQNSPVPVIALLSWHPTERAHVLALAKEAASNAWISLTLDDRFLRFLSLVDLQEDAQTLAQLGVKLTFTLPEREAGGLHPIPAKNAHDDCVNDCANAYYACSDPCMDQACIWDCQGVADGCVNGCPTCTPNWVETSRTKIGGRATSYCFIGCDCRVVSYFQVSEHDTNACQPDRTRCDTDAVDYYVYHADECCLGADISHSDYCGGSTCN